MKFEESFTALSKPKKVGLILTLLIATIVGCWSLSQMFPVRQPQKQEEVASIPYERTEGLIVRLLDASIVQLKAEFTLNSFVYMSSYDLWRNQPDFIERMGSFVIEALYFKATEFDVTQPTYLENRTVLLQKFFDDTENIRQLVNKRYPGVVEELKITVLKSDIE